MSFYKRELGAGGQPPVVVTSRNPGFFKAAGRMGMNKLGWRATDLEQDTANVLRKKFKSEVEHAIPDEAKINNILDSLSKHNRANKRKQFFDIRHRQTVGLFRTILTTPKFSFKTKQKALEVLKEYITEDNGDDVLGSRGTQARVDKSLALEGLIKYIESPSYEAVDEIANNLGFFYRSPKDEKSGWIRAMQSDSDHADIQHLGFYKKLNNSGNHAARLIYELLVADNSSFFKDNTIAAEKIMSLDEADWPKSITNPAKGEAILAHLKKVDQKTFTKLQASTSGDLHMRWLGIFGDTFEIVKADAALMEELTGSKTEFPEGFKFSYVGITDEAGKITTQGFVDKFRNPTTRHTAIKELFLAYNVLDAQRINKIADGEAARAEELGQQQKILLRLLSDENITPKYILDGIKEFFNSDTGRAVIVGMSLGMQDRLMTTLSKPFASEMKKVIGNDFSHLENIKMQVIDEKASYFVPDEILAEYSKLALEAHTRAANTDITAARAILAEFYRSLPAHDDLVGSAAARANEYHAAKDMLAQLVSPRVADDAVDFNIISQALDQIKSIGLEVVKDCENVHDVARYQREVVQVGIDEGTKQLSDELFALLPEGQRQETNDSLLYEFLYKLERDLIEPLQKAEKKRLDELGTRDLGVVDTRTVEGTEAAIQARIDINDITHFSNQWIANVEEYIRRPGNQAIRDNWSKYFSISIEDFITNQKAGGTESPSGILAQLRQNIKHYELRGTELEQVFKGTEFFDRIFSTADLTHPSGGEALIAKVLKESDYRDGENLGMEFGVLRSMLKANKDLNIHAVYKEAFNDELYGVADVRTRMVAVAELVRRLQNPIHSRTDVEQALDYIFEDVLQGKVPRDAFTRDNLNQALGTTSRENIHSWFNGAGYAFGSFAKFVSLNSINTSPEAFGDTVERFTRRIEAINGLGFQPFGDTKSKIANLMDLRDLDIVLDVNIGRTEKWVLDEARASMANFLSVLQSPDKIEETEAYMDTLEEKAEKYRASFNAIEDMEISKQGAARQSLFREIEKEFSLKREEPIFGVRESESFFDMFRIFTEQDTNSIGYSNGYFESFFELMRSIFEMMKGESR